MQVWPGRMGVHKLNRRYPLYRTYMLYMLDGSAAKD
jgi:hypothetical protein